ncbi:hypothetical protein [Saccharopolyspora sp. NPDC002376]
MPVLIVEKRGEVTLSKRMGCASRGQLHGGTHLVVSIADQLLQDVRSRRSRRGVLIADYFGECRPDAPVRMAQERFQGVAGGVGEDQVEVPCEEGRFVAFVQVCCIQQAVDIGDIKGTLDESSDVRPEFGTELAQE